MINANDGHDYKWDWCQDCYYDATTGDYARTMEVPPASAKELMAEHGLVLNAAETRSPKELITPGPAELTYDTKGKVISAMVCNIGVIVCLPEWRDVVWENEGVQS